MRTLGRNPKDEYYENCIEQYKFLIPKVMRELRVKPWDREECYQLGLIALCSAMDYYDPDRFIYNEEIGEDGFTGYVHNAIKYAMLGYLIKERKRKEREIPMSCVDRDWLKNILNGEVSYDSLF